MEGSFGMGHGKSPSRRVFFGLSRPWVMVPACTRWSCFWIGERNGIVLELQVAPSRGEQRRISTTTTTTSNGLPPASPSPPPRLPATTEPLRRH
ncbi:hypothetical protein M0802_000426 [Mischocyttarus mexicanus]|nr:hypothetical protein M0802_000426 [Mischocyttarus mexicanus]